MRVIAALLIVATVSLVGLSSVEEASAQAVARPEADLQLVGSVDQAPAGGGITTNDTMSYRVTIRNAGPTEIPARGLLLVLYVDRSGGSQPWPMEVAGFEAAALRPPAGGSCGVGRREFIQCTNVQAVPPDGTIDVRISHRHPEAVDGALTFVAEVNLSRNTIVDPAGGNNTYRGPTYGFVNPPTPTSTTTSSSTTSSTMPSSTSSTAASSTSSSSTSSTVESTTSSSSTTSMQPSSSSTTSTTAPATLATTTTLLTPLSGSANLMPSVVTVDAAQGTASSNPDDQLVLGPIAEEPQDGPPYALLGALVFAMLALGGVGLATYAHLNRGPPLVDIRSFD